MNDLSPKTAAILVFLFLAAIVASALYDLQPPKPISADAPDTLFSADRAAGFIRDIAREPHPLGSAANDSVRRYITNQLSSFGLHPQLDTAVVTGSYNGIHYAASVVNIVARIPGTANTRAVLLMAHYDSVPTGPGASDDASGVASILETLRALKASLPLKNDIVAVFTDGEEVGMMGGQALSENDTLLKTIGVALNFEARGTFGPSLMFETNPNDASGNGNGWLINQLASSGADPVATPISGEAYKHLPNNTDFSWLKSKGVPGMNFAFIGGIDRYHSELDNYSHLDEASIQHDGSYALELSKIFGNSALPGPKTVNYVYFNFFWPAFVAYPSSLVTALTVLATILFSLMAYVGIRKSVINLKKAIIGLVLPIVPIALLGVGSFFLWRFIRGSYAESGHFLFGAFYGDGLYLCALIAMALALTSAFYIFMRRFLRSSEMAVGFLFWWLAAAIVCTYYFPDGAYFFQFPIIFSAFALLIFFLAPKSDFRSPIVLLALLVCGVPGVYLTSATAYLFYMVGLLPGIAAGIVVLVIFAVGTILPHIAIIASPGKWLLPIAALVAALALGTVAILTHHLDELHPKTDSVDYAVNVNDSTAYWISFDDSTDEWTSQFFSSRTADDTIPGFFPGWWRTPALAAKAVPIALPPVSVKLVSDSSSGGARFMTFLVKSPEASGSVTLTADIGTHVLSSSVDGRPIPDSVAIFPAGKQERWSLHYYGLPVGGATVALVIPAGEGIRFTTIEIVDGLPEVGGLPRYPRPASIIQRPFVTTDAAIVVKSYSF
jgi:Peptidase family M28